MRTFKTKRDIKNQLLESLKTGEGIHVEATEMVNGGTHHYWLTGTTDDYEIHCYGSGPGWFDQGDDCKTQDIDELVSKIWIGRKYILETVY
jgi:hypothetical protein